MVRLLILLAGSLFAAAAGASGGERHQWAVDVDFGAVTSSSGFEPWTEGGFGKLRFDDNDFGVTRVLAEYRGRLTPTLWARISADYVDDASPGVGLTEAYLQWRPIPDSPLRQQWRLGAFYPPFSRENGGPGWSSPFLLSFSAINTWLGEEIRPVGIEWSARRPLGPRSSPHELGVFAAAFYGNDPAATLLFWRGWAIHDRQTRVGDDLPLPPAPIWQDGEIVDFREQSVEPIAEIDHRPGYYAGLEWRYARQAMLSVGYYDNRSDPEAFANGQWGWDTAFWNVAGQLELPWDVGIVAQWMSGETYWLSGALPNGSRTPGTELVCDEFDSKFLLVTKRLADAHRLTLRYDEFDYSRAPDKSFDSGHAWTVGYRYDPGGRVALVLEWLAIDSARDLWTDFYAAPGRMSERQLRGEIVLRLGPRRFD